MGKFLLFGFILILVYLLVVHSGGAAAVLSGLSSGGKSTINAFQGAGG